jgi:hypothetical protein
MVLGIALTAAFVLAAPLLAGILALAGGIGYLITQTDMFKTHQDMVTQAHQRATKAADDEKQALQDLKDALKADENASYNLEGAQLALQHAQKNLSDVTKQFGKDSLEAKDARHQLRGAEDDVAAAQQNVNDKMADAKKKLDEEQKAHDAMVKKNANYVTEIGKQRSAWDDVAGAIHGAWDWLTKYLAPDLNNKSAVQARNAALALPHHASGTAWSSGGLAVVGENGPELVNLPRGSSVIPNHQMNQYDQSRKTNVTLGPVYVQNNMDVDSIMRRLSFALRTDSSL